MCDAIDQEFLAMEIAMIKHNIEFKRVGYMYVIPGFSLLYRGPSIDWRLRIHIKEKYFGRYSDFKLIADLSNIYKKYLLINEFEILDIDIKKIIPKMMISLIT